jgi:hypothetical protein
MTPKKLEDARGFPNNCNIISNSSGAMYEHIPEIPMMGKC